MNKKIKREAQLAGEMPEQGRTTDDLKDFKPACDNSINDPQLLRELVDQLNDAIFIVSPETGQFLDFNETACRTLGYGRRELLNMCVCDICTDVTDASVWQKKIAAVREKGHLIHEGLQRRKDGSTFPVELNIRYVSLYGPDYLTVICRDITRRRQTENELEQERKQLLSIFNSISEPIYVSDPKTHEILFVNSEIKRLMGNDPVGGVCYREFQGLDSPCDFCTNKIILKKKGKHYQWEYHNLKYDRHAILTDSIIKWPDGRDVRLEFAVDITERKKAEEALRDSEDQIRLITDALPVLIAYIDADQKFHFNNRAYEDWFGLSRNEICGKHIKQILGSKIYNAIEEYVRQALAGLRVSFETMLPYKDGGSRYIHATYVPDVSAGGHVRGFFALMSDITEHVKAEEELRIRDSAIASSISAFAMIDMETKLTYVNKAFLKMWGHDDEREILGRSAVSFWQDEEELREVFNKLKDKGNWAGELIGKNKCGRPMDIQIAVSVVKDRNGKPVSIFGSFIDMTGKKLTEIGLKDSEIKLHKQKLELEQKNTALREMIHQIDIEKTRLKEDIATHIYRVLMPLVFKLDAGENILKYRDLIKYHLEELLSSFGHNTVMKGYMLTPKETEICNMIRGRLSTKEICNLLCVSPQTVEKHRKNIRKKIGLSNKKINLTSFLQDLKN